MSENQLREAYTLMKQGDKQGASRLVQGVLKEDRSNANAWWLFSHLLEDEDKIVKSLEKVLALNPEHLGARKKLASMRPEFAHLTVTPEPKAKAKTEQQSAAYWSKLDASAKVKPAQVTTDIGAMLWRSMGIRFKLFIIILPFMIAYGIYFNFNNQQSFHDKNGDTPLTIAALYLEAIYREDYDTLYMMSCPDYYFQVDLWKRDGLEFAPSEITVDLSATEFGIFYQNGDQAFVSVRGVTSITYPARTFTIDWQEEAAFQNADVYGQHFQKSADDVWQACVEFYVPNLEMSADN